ncbi:MAG: alpha-E domain-containing protein [Sandaracinus sp.]|nr:alpha-E domain-containing protein [Sandaracinus sp.]
MISRVAGCCFWLHRYVERAENLARLLKVNRSFLLDVPEGVADRWHPLIIVSGEQEGVSRSSTRRPRATTARSSRRTSRGKSEARSR